MKTVLIFEEDDTLCQILKSYIEEYLHMKVVCTRDREEVFSLLELNQVDIVVLGMSPYNERQLGGIVQLAKNYYKTKVAILSTTGDPNKIRQKFDADYGLSKPFSWDDFSSIFI